MYWYVRGVKKDEFGASGRIDGFDWFVPACYIAVI